MIALKRNASGFRPQGKEVILMEQKKVGLKANLMFALGAVFWRIGACLLGWSEACLFAGHDKTDCSAGNGGTCVPGAGWRMPLERTPCAEARSAGAVTEAEK